MSSPPSYTNPTLQQDSKTKEAADIGGGSAPTSTPNVALGSSTKSTTDNGESTRADSRSPALTHGSKTEPLTYSAAVASSLKDETIHPALTDALENARGESLRRSNVLSNLCRRTFGCHLYPFSYMITLSFTRGTNCPHPTPPQQHGPENIRCSAEHPGAGAGLKCTHNQFDTVECLFVSSFEVYVPVHPTRHINHIKTQDCK